MTRGFPEPNEAVAADARLEERFRFGGCYQMAIALADRLGWEVEALVADMRPRGRAPYRHVVHAWVVDPEGRAFDAAGWLDRATLPDDFLGCPRDGYAGSSVVPVGDAGAFRALLVEYYNASSWQPDAWAAHEMDRTMAEMVDEAGRAADDYVIPRWLEAPAAAPRM
jgi:hypothetical protein